VSVIAAARRTGKTVLAETLAMHTTFAHGGHPGAAAGRLVEDVGAAVVGACRAQHAPAPVRALEGPELQESAAALLEAVENRDRKLAADYKAASATGAGFLERSVA
jgi:hypothetical protein